MGYPTKPTGAGVLADGVAAPDGDRVVDGESPDFLAGECLAAVGLGSGGIIVVEDIEDTYLVSGSGP